MTRRLQVVGAGLLGTSVGLAVAGRWDVWVCDADSRAESLAHDLGAGTGGWSEEEPDLVLLAVPPSAVAPVMESVNRLYPHCTVSDVASVKTQPQVDAEKTGLHSRFVGGHPMAGRERSGARAARADLFEARPWVLCPTDEVSAERMALVEELVRDCGADPVRMTAAAHDEAVALVSHLPQVVASAVAGELAEAGDQTLGLAGQGLRDTVRIARSDADLWSDILAANAGVVAPHVLRLAAGLTAVGSALRDYSEGKSTKGQVDEAVQRLMRDGQLGARRIPGKHGAPARQYAVVPVVVPDEPGALARLFATVANVGASVEDISLEHSPGHPVGVIELSVDPGQAEALTARLREAGWSAH